MGKLANSNIIFTTKTWDQGYTYFKQQKGVYSAFFKLTDHKTDTLGEFKVIR